MSSFKCFKCFSVTITAELLKTAVCKYSTRSATAFQTASTYFLMNVKNQTAFLDKQQEPSLQTNKYCDAILNLIWEEGAKQPFLELTIDYQTTTNLD